VHSKCLFLLVCLSNVLKFLQLVFLLTYIFQIQWCISSLSLNMCISTYEGRKEGCFVVMRSTKSWCFSILGVFGKLSMKRGAWAWFHGVWTCGPKNCLSRKKSTWLSLKGYVGQRHLDCLSRKKSTSGAVQCFCCISNWGRPQVELDIWLAVWSANSTSHFALPGKPQS